MPFCKFVSWPDENLVKRDNTTYVFRTVFHSSLLMGLHGSGFPSFPILAGIGNKKDCRIDLK